MVNGTPTAWRRRVRRPLLITLLLLSAMFPLLATESRAVNQGQFDSLTVYAIQPVTVTEESALQVAADVFGVEGEIDLVEGHYIVRDGDRTVDVNIESGGAWFADEAQLWNTDLTPTLPAQEEALQIVDDFLKEKELLPTSRVISPTFRTMGGTYMATMSVNERGQQVRGPNRQLDTQVVYGLVMSGTNLPIVGGGGEFNVTLGNAGEMIGYSDVWRTLQGPMGDYEVLPPPTAEQAFGRAMLGGIQITSLDSRLAYYSAPNALPQEFLYPVYEVWGTGQLGSVDFPLRTVLMPATTFNPDAQITTPAANIGVAPTDQPLTFEGTATFGTPPYTYAWESSIDGPLGEGASLTASLTAFARAGGGFATHIVQLTVTDANGMTATDEIAITVEGVTVMLPLVAQNTVDLRASAANAPQFGGDEGIAEAGTSWIGELGGLGGSLNNAKGFVDGMRGLGWRINFNWGNQSAFHSDWTTNDDAYIDAADFVFYTGHANLEGWQAAQTGGDGWVSYDELTPAHSPRDLWGSDDLEWLIVAACGPLQDETLSPGGGDVFRWATAFDGLHMLLGYGAVTSDNTVEGQIMVSYLRSGRSIIDSWFRTARDVQDATNSFGPPDGPTIWVGVMYVSRPGADPRFERIPGFGPFIPDPTNPTDYTVLWTTT